MESYKYTSAELNHISQNFIDTILSIYFEANDSEAISESQIPEFFSSLYIEARGFTR